jgi:hypothetical protein
MCSCSLILAIVFAVASVSAPSLSLVVGPFAEIVIRDFLIDPRCVIVDISTVLYLDASKGFPNLEDVEFHLCLVG